MCGMIGKPLAYVALSLLLAFGLAGCSTPSGASGASEAAGASDASGASGASEAAGASGASGASDSSFNMSAVMETISVKADEAAAQLKLERLEQAAQARIERERREAQARAEEAARIDAERRAREFLEAERQKAKRSRSWRERFPTDDYTNTLLIGDSIMQQTKRTLEDTLPGVEVNADSGRSLETGGLVFENADPGKGVLDHVRDDDGDFDRYVIGTGNNDYGGMPLEAAEEIIECLGEDKEIYFITEIVTGNKRGTETTNDTIDEVVERYPNVHKIDWHGLVEGDEDEFLIDGCHPRPECYEDYAQLIKDGLDEIH